MTSAATAENQQAVVQSRLRTVAVREIMTADPVTRLALATVTQFLDELLPWLRHSAFPVVDGRAGGGAGDRAPGQRRSRRTNATGPRCGRSLCRPRWPGLPPDEPVADLLPRGWVFGRAVLVFDGGRLAGIVAPADISRALERISGNRGAFGPAGRGRRP